MLTLQILTDKGVPVVALLSDQDLRRIQDELCSQDDWSDGVRDSLSQYVVGGFMVVQLDRTARTGIIGNESSGILVSCVVLAICGPNGLSGLR